ncbi:hypothetical protein EV702DRAFT_1109954 [Suillus placidus]|uniref:RING-type domain-containing protein n=1 Tax=Suillus placidus TaxID=48579 RepID=A0A9P7D241_9AGAM|nr:hypothetical protein EV702DRAFT_1109954 [Suillus placidus]
MASISTWYHNQYSTWNRTRRLHATPFLARTDTHTSRTATSMARANTQDAVVINMDDATSKEKKQETLFGPNIGVVGSTPQWAQSIAQKAPADNVSSNIIQNWITRSKEPSQPTTTLQALVNLKRPTLRLCPLTISSGDDSDQVDSHHNHGLEFEYDCDAAKCRINVSVVLPADHPYAETIDSTGYSCISVFESIVDGGFGKVLHLDEGATLELGRFEHKHTEAETASSQTTGVPESAPVADSVDSSAPASSRNDRVRKRFTGFNFRKRSANTAVSGPALAVVDAEVSAPTVEGSEEKEDKEEVKDGVRVTIQLMALDEDGTDLSVANEQITYLHVVRFGAVHDDEKEDSRPWVVKVVKREATIGPHTFHLHEIYGLSSQSTSSSQAQAASPASDAHTYPPTSGSAAPMHEDEPSSECLLCLSSPREVILLPCRHLVACKECAINMVEFGAGGNIIHNEETTAATTGGEASATEVSAPAPPTIAQNIRRKRKAKGWFCPVCRQPYTSLLRISTTPPTKDISDDGHRASIDEHEHEDDEHEHEHEHEHDPEDEHDDHPLATAPPVPGSTMFNSIRSGLMRLSVARSDGGATENTHPAEVPASIV